MVIALPDRNSNASIVHHAPHANQEYNVESMHVLTEKTNTSEKSNGTKNILESEIPSQEQNVTFKTTDHDTIVCSSCGFEQPAGRAVCWKCGSKFSKEDKISQ